MQQSDVINSCILAACTAEPVATIRSSHKVGQAIEGEYIVHFGKDLVFIGRLNLSNGQYAFIPQLGVEEEMASAKSRFFFTKYPKGTYHVEYDDSIRSDSVLDNLKNNEILLTIMFDAVEAENRAPNPFQATDRAFFIRSDKEGSRLYFHSTVNEFELWRVEKPWNHP